MNIEAELKIQDDANEILERYLAIAIKALEYCAADPGSLHPMNNRQNAAAMNALSEIRWRPDPKSLDTKKKGA